MQVIFLRVARKDVREAYRWYERRAPGLGIRFVSEVIEYSKKISLGTIEYRNYIPGIQRLQLVRFPFSIFFMKEGSIKALVIAVLHNRQNIIKILSKRV